MITQFLRRADKCRMLFFDLEFKTEIHSKNLHEQNPCVCVGAVGVRATFICSQFSIVFYPALLPTIFFISCCTSSAGVIVPSLSHALPVLIRVLTPIFSVLL